MRLFRFSAETGRNVDRFASRFAMTGVVRSVRPMQAGFAHLPPGGLIGRHPAVANQLLMVTAGSGWVSGDDGARRPIAVGEAAFWDAGELHETGSDEGLTALILEGPDVEPSRLAPREG